MLDVPAPLLDARDIRKAYGGVLALKGASLSVVPGEIHALLGENGAGKSTLIKCLAGTPAPDSGVIKVDGQTLSASHSPADATAAGLAFIHQESSLIENLTVEENIALTEGYPRKRGMIDWRAVRRRAHEALDRLGVHIDPGALVWELPIAARTTVAIARALALDAKILVLDEPTASLGAKDVAALFTALRRISAQGSGIVFVSHRLDEVYELSDRLTVLRDGANAGTAERRDLSRRELVKMICGHDVHFVHKGSSLCRTAPVIEAHSFEGESIAPFDFKVGAGEIVGFTGLSDAGHYELARMLFGLAPIVGGTAKLESVDFAPASPVEAMHAGVGYVPPDRNGEGLAREMTLAENLFLNPEPQSIAMAGSSWIRASREVGAARDLLTRFKVRPPIPEAYVATLSGGNAQKVLLARWLSRKSKLLLINDVSVGVDIGAREEIYAAIRQAAEAGSAVMIVTSDLEEIENLCSRAYVFIRGVLKAELNGDDVRISAISAALAGDSVAHNNSAAGGVNHEQ